MAPTTKPPSPQIKMVVHLLLAVYIMFVYCKKKYGSLALNGLLCLFIKKKIAIKTIIIKKLKKSTVSIDCQLITLLLYNYTKYNFQRLTHLFLFLPYIFSLINNASSR